MNCEHIEAIVTVDGDVISATGPHRPSLWGMVIGQLWNTFGVGTDYDILTDDDVGHERLGGCRTPAQIEIRVKR